MKRTMFLACAGLTLGSTAALSAAASNHGGSERNELQPMSARPVRIAPIIGRDANGMPIAGQWMPYKGSGTDGTDRTELFDHYEGSTFCTVGTIPFPPTDGAALGGFDPSCSGLTQCDNATFAQTGRWWLGADFRGSTYLTHIEALAQNVTPIANEVAIDFNVFLNPTQLDICGEPIDRLVIAITSYDASVGALMDGLTPITAQNLEDGFLDGVILDFGNIPNNAGQTARYVTLADLTGGDPELPVNVEEGGALETVFLDATLNGQELVFNRFSANNQATLWKSKDVPLQGTTNGNTGLDGNTVAAYCTDGESGDGEYADTEVGTEVETADCPETIVAAVGLYGDPSGGEELCPTAFTRVRGLPVSGDLASTCDSDDNYLTTRPDVFRTVAIPPVQVQLDYTSTDNPPQLVLVVESAANVANIFQRINLFNFDTNLYESVDTSVLGTTDGTRTVTITTNPGRFVSSTGQVRALLQCNALAFTIAPIWQYRIDMATVEK